MDRIPLFPLQAILFPSADLGIHVFEERYRALVAACLEAGEGFGVVLIRRGREVGGPAEPHAVGTVARIAAYARLPDGRYLLEVEGRERFRIRALSNGAAPYPQAEVTLLPEPIGDFGRARAASKAVETLARRYWALNHLAPAELPADPVARSYVVANALRIDPWEKQAILETDGADLRLERLASILRRELAVLEHLRKTRG